MKNMKKVVIVEVVAIIIVIVLGTLFHFLYEWTQNNCIALISPVNESNWEHIKIMFYPYLLVSVFEYFFFGKDTHNYVFGKAIGVLTFIIVTFGLTVLMEIFTQDPPFILHFIAYIAGAVIGQYVSYQIITDKDYGGCTRWLGYVILVLFIIIITLFTFRPLHHDFFMDKNTMTYGIPED